MSEFDEAILLGTAQDGGVPLSPNPYVTPVSVPDRGEFSDPARRLFSCPDIDGWNGWEHDLKRFVARMDVAFTPGVRLPFR
jgi:hypothetical protein